MPACDLSDSQRISLAGMFWVLQVRSMEAVGVRPDTYTYTTLLDGYCRDGQLDKAEALLAKMEDSKSNQKPSIYTYNIFIKACASKVNIISTFPGESTKLLLVVSHFPLADIDTQLLILLGTQLAFLFSRDMLSILINMNHLPNSFIGCNV